MCSAVSISFWATPRCSCLRRDTHGTAHRDVSRARGARAVDRLVPQLLVAPLGVQNSGRCCDARNLSYLLQCLRVVDADHVSRPIADEHLTSVSCELRMQRHLPLANHTDDVERSLFLEYRDRVGGVGEKGVGPNVWAHTRRSDEEARPLGRHNAHNFVGTEVPYGDLALTRMGRCVNRAVRLPNGSGPRVWRVARRDALH